MTFNETRNDLIELQNSLRKKLIRNVTCKNFRYVGGADLTFVDDLYIGCFVVIDCENSLQPVYEKCKRFNVNVPYVPGLLCFREGPVVVDLYKEFCLSNPGIKLDALLVDGCGEWHPRGFGLACYVGLECNLPTIGVSKSFLYVGSSHHGKEVQNEAQDKCKNIGDTMKLTFKLEDGYEKPSCARPICVSTVWRR